MQKGSLFITGSIQTKKNRTNYFAVLNIYDESGKRKLKWIDTHIPVKGNNKCKANEALKKIITEYEEKSDNNINLSKDVLFIDFITHWLETEKRNIQPTTYDAYKLTLNTHIIQYFQPMKLKLSGITRHISTNMLISS